MVSRGLIVALLVGAVVISGVVVALNFYVGPPKKTATSGPEIVVRELFIGTPAGQDAAKLSALGQLATKNSYAVGEPLAVRITTDTDPTLEIPISVRLVSRDGTVSELSPSTVNVRGGTSGYCCWRVSEPNTYTLQVVRPDGRRSAIPLTITAP